MAGKEEDDFDIDIDTSDELGEQLRAELGKLQSEDDDDDGGFDQPLDEDSITKRDVVEEEEGTQRAASARDRDAAGRFAKAEGEGEKKADPIALEEPGKAAENPPADPAVVETMDDQAYAAELEKLPPTMKARVNADREALSGFTRIFHGKEAMLNGATPQRAVEQLVNIFEYANRDPGQYTAWMIGEYTRGDMVKTEAILKAAAEAHGFTITKADAAAAPDAEDDDPFATPKEKELAARVRQLEASQQPQRQTIPGPHSPEETLRRSLQDVFGETGADGQFVRQNFAAVQGVMKAIITDMVASGRQMDRAAVIEAYEAAELATPATREAAQQRAAQRSNLSATPPANVADNQKKAEATARAKAASTKIIDGPGQSAGRQPADEDGDLGIDDFLRKKFFSGSRG